MALDGGSIKEANSRTQLFLSLCSVASGLDKLMLTTGYLNTELEPDFFLCQRLLISTHLCVQRHLRGPVSCTLSPLDDLVGHSSLLTRDYSAGTRQTLQSTTFLAVKSFKLKFINSKLVPRPWGVPPYMAHMGMCHWTGYGFCPLCPKQCR